MILSSNSHWNKTQNLLNKALDTEYTRRRVIADNIANIDVPHFKRSEVSFEGQMRRALNSERNVKTNEIPVKTTNKRHIPFFRSLDYNKVSHKVHVDYLTTMRNDGNNIDIEHEMAASLKNQLRYQLLSDQMSQNFKMLSSVMRLA